MSEETDFIPVLIGGDMNCYSVARAIHEQYGKKSYAFGRFAAGDTMHSRIVECQYNEDLDKPDVLLATIKEFVQTAETMHLVWGCADVYAELLSEIQDDLPKNCVTLYINADLRDRLESKTSFYQMCEEHGLPYPTTFSVEPARFGEGLSEADVSESILGFSYPVIVKPAMSVTSSGTSLRGHEEGLYGRSPAEALRIFGVDFRCGLS